jgi:hypothetical protein
MKDKVCEAYTEMRNSYNILAKKPESSHFSFTVKTTPNKQETQVTGLCQIITCDK